MSLKLSQNKGEPDDMVHKVRVKPYNMPKHIKNGKTFRLYADTYKNQ